MSRICPKCESHDVVESTNFMHDIAGIPPIYTCNACGFSGSLFPETTE